MLDIGIFDHWVLCILTSKDIWYLPALISSSCLPSLFFGGHLASSSLKEVVSISVIFPEIVATYLSISLSAIIFFICLITAALMETVKY